MVEKFDDIELFDDWWFDDWAILTLLTTDGQMDSQTEFP